MLFPLDHVLDEKMNFEFQEDDDYDEYDGSTKPKMIPRNKTGPGSVMIRPLRTDEVIETLFELRRRCLNRRLPVIIF